MEHAPTHLAYVDLADDLTWFIKCPELRVMHIETGADQRAAVLQQLVLTEGHPHNHSPFFLLEDAHANDDAGWVARAERLGAIHEARREALVPEGLELAPLRPLVHTGDDLSLFAWQMQQVLMAMTKAPVLSGACVVLAPTRLESASRFAKSLESLLGLPTLAPVRIILVEHGVALANVLEKSLGAALLRSRCVIASADLQHEHRTSLAAAAKRAAASSDPLRVGAGPANVIAPPRHGKPPRDAALTPEQQALLTKELGPMAALTGPNGQWLRSRILQAANAMQEHRFVDAIGLQGEAVQQCSDIGLFPLAVTLEVTMATYLLHAGAPERARAAYENAASRADALGLHVAAANARLGLAAAIVVSGDLVAGSTQYARAGEAAERGGEPMLAIEAYRTAGQIALRAHAEKAAITAWQRALEVANATPPEATATSSAALTARSLAKVLQARGVHQSAQALLEQADAYESGMSSTQGQHARQ